MKKYILNLLVFSAILSAQTSPTIYWVDATNGNDNSAGTTEATAWKTIHKVFVQSLFKQTVVDTVKVKAGTYDFEDGEIYTNSNYDFVLIGIEGSSKTIFDAGNKNRHMSIDDGQSNKTKIQGITFQNGFTNYWPGGGSIFLTYGSDVQFIDCIWQNNSTNGQEGGGAIIIRDGATPSFTGCTFKGNYVNNTDGGNYGGAVNIQWPNSKAELESTVKFKKTKFIDNYLKVKHSAYGGAVRSERNVAFENCLFVNNRVIANNDGTGSEAVGGAIYFNSKYWNGSSNDGGVMKIVNSTFHGNYIQTLDPNYSNMYGGTISYGSHDGNANSKTYIFNTIVSGSKQLIEQTERTQYDNNDYIVNKIIGTGNTSGYKLTLDHSNILNQKIWHHPRPRYRYRHYSQSHYYSQTDNFRIPHSFHWQRHHRRHYASLSNNYR